MMKFINSWLRQKEFKDSAIILSEKNIETIEPIDARISPIFG